MKKCSYELLIANRKYKDTIFRWIFSQIENLLSLYNAVTGKHYQNPEELEIVTLENAIYMGMKNDLAFVLEMGLYLYEHQSTYNPNIPLRDLFYIASEYQDLVDEKSLYSSGIQKIPTPSFLVFYNGTDRNVPGKVKEVSKQLHANPKAEIYVFLFHPCTGSCKVLKQRKIIAKFEPSEFGYYATLTIPAQFAILYA